MRLFVQVRYMSPLNQVYRPAPLLDVVLHNGVQAPPARASTADAGLGKEVANDPLGCAGLSVFIKSTIFLLKRPPQCP